MISARLKFTFMISANCSHVQRHLWKPVGVAVSLVSERTGMSWSTNMAAQGGSIIAWCAWSEADICSKTVSPSTTRTGTPGYAPHWLAEVVQVR